MFATSFVPVATAWIGKDLNARGPEIFYAIVYTLWTMSYLFLTHKIIMSDKANGYKKSAEDVKSMKIYKTLTNWKNMSILVLVTIVALIFFPAGQLAIVSFQIIFIGAKFNDDSDNLF